MMVSLKLVKPVLILIIMEDTLRDHSVHGVALSIWCLNPYYNGRYSPSVRREYICILYFVLILIIMEDTLRGQ